jgi:hypothetical protein
MSMKNVTFMLYQSKPSCGQPVVGRVQPRLSSSAELHEQRDEGEDEDGQGENEGGEDGRDNDLVAVVLAT